MDYELNLEGQHSFSEKNAEERACQSEAFRIKVQEEQGLPNVMDNR